SSARLAGCSPADTTSGQVRARAADDETPIGRHVSMTGVPMRMIRRAYSVAMVLAVSLGAALGTATASAAPTTSQGGITRTILAQAIPTNAPGQTLYLEEVRIAPKAKLATHLHEGTQIASVRAGVLTYNIVSGTVSVTRADGSTKDVTGPSTVQLRRGDAIT